LAALLTVLCAVFAAGCGTEETTSADLPGAIAYAPKDAFAVVLVPTDFEGEQLRRLERLFQPSLAGGSLRREIFDSGGRVDYERDVAPLLGDTLVIAGWGPTDAPKIVAVLETPDAAKARSLVRKLDDIDARTDGSTVVLSLTGGDSSVGDAIDRKQEGTGMTGEDFASAYGDGAGDDALVRVFGDARVLASELDVADAEVPWIAALRSVAASVRLDEDAIDVRARVRTNPDDLGEEDLPLATGDDSPEAGDVDGAITSANRDQSRTTVFLAGLARAAYPDSAFVREVEKLESDLGISFEDEVLKQFNGPSASIAWPDGSFAAVSEVADPERMRALLPRIAPRLPAILRGLQGLGNTGLVALLLMAPDAPLVPGALPALRAGIDVERLPGGDLYEITGLDDESEGPEFAVPSVVFGMIGDRFVVGTDENQARTVAKMDVSEVDDARGAAVVRADLGSWWQRAFDEIGVKTLPFGQMTGGLEASRNGIEGRLRIAVPDGLD
jgi:hypothetical protein